MRVSDLQFSDFMKTNSYAGHRVQTTTDANRIVNNQKSCDQFIAEFGDVEIQYDERYNVYRVGVFFGQREKYIAAKQIDCDRYGCE